MSKLPSLSEFWEMLDKADWNYMMSDDAKVNRRGHLAMLELSQISRRNKQLSSLMKGFCEAQRSDMFYKQMAHVDKPPRPVELHTTKPRIKLKIPH